MKKSPLPKLKTVGYIHFVEHDCYHIDTAEG
jgi:hypothetical protein